MGIVTELLQDIPLPKMVRISQNFSTFAIQDVAATLREELRKPTIAGRVKKDMRIAVAVGSRGVADIPLIVRIVVEELKKLGGKPFIVPAMGSHGGATAEGQAAVLAALGVTESSAGCPIISCMDTVELGVLENRLPVLMDKNAMQADGIVVINRVKPHTSFSGANESGLAKMITIGLGKQKGADSCHMLGFQHMEKLIVEMARIKFQQAPFLFGVGIVENSYDKVAKIAAIPAEEIIECEKQLLVEAKKNMPKILFNPLDILVVDSMGKEFSGAGCDPHVTGRASVPYITMRQQTTRLVVLDITDQSHGNATGMGLADITTRRLVDKIDFDFTYANVLTATTVQAARIPLTVETDRLAIQAAVKTCNVAEKSRIRMVRIPNTLHIGHIYISECMLEEARQQSNITVLDEPAEFVFDAAGNLADIGMWG
ncbi:MAG: lactate racemase domain-containing protein [Negativicutes bacterium]